jgi:hypothetical protein
MADQQFSPEQYQELFGNMVGKELEKMNQEDANFDPRGQKAQDIDRLTKSLVDGMIDSQKSDSYDNAIRSNNDLKYIVDLLISNPVIIPYIGKYLDTKVEAMKKQIDNLMQQTFDVD